MHAWPPAFVPAGTLLYGPHRMASPSFPGLVARLIAIGILLVGAILAIGVAGSLQSPAVVEAELAVPGLPPGTEIRAVHLTDIHTSWPDMPRRRLESIVEQVNALEPDLILLTGDHFGGKIWALEAYPIEDALDPLKALSAPLGVVAVRGNHDDHWVLMRLRRLGTIKVLVNAHVDLGPIVIVGLDSAKYGPDLDRAVAGVPAGKPVIGLVHEPEVTEWLPPQGWPMVAGHTHGGQVHLPLLGAPWAWFQGRFPCRRGNCEVNGWDLFVSSGLGTSILPIRIGVRPEIVVLRLYGPSGRKSGTEK
ncbi:MAG: metallophosphoesterase [Sphingomonadaceae bacterium]